MFRSPSFGYGLVLPLPFLFHQPWINGSFCCTQVLVYFMCPHLGSPPHSTQPACDRSWTTWIDGWIVLELSHTNKQCTEAVNCIHQQSPSCITARLSVFCRMAARYGANGILLLVSLSLSRTLARLLKRKKIQIISCSVPYALLSCIWETKVEHYTW